EPAQRGLTGRADVLRAPAELPHVRIAAALDAELGREHDPVAPAAQEPADQLLVVAAAVHVRGVEEGHADLERRLDCRQRLGLVGLPVELRHAHAAEADRGDRRAVRAELARLHASFIRQFAGCAIIPGMADTSLVSVREARDRTIAILSDLFASSDLELEEFEKRVSLVHRAATVAEIEGVVGDLKKPDHVVKPQPSVARVPVSAAPERQTRLAIFGGIDKRGAWTMPRYLHTVAVFGGANLDLREARLPPGIVEIRVFALFGGVQIIVPPDL